jgi:hypothetical protein
MRTAMGPSRKLPVGQVNIGRANRESSPRSKNIPLARRRASRFCPEMIVIDLDRFSKLPLTPPK